MQRPMERINRRFYNDVIEAVNEKRIRLNKTNKGFIEKVSFCASDDCCQNA